MERWLAAVERAAGWSSALARELALAAQLVKGYGEVRRRMQAAFDDLLAATGRAADLERARGGDGRIATDLARRYRALVREGPEREAEARALARDTLARLEAGVSVELDALAGA